MRWVASGKGALGAEGNNEGGGTGPEAEMVVDMAIVLDTILHMSSFHYTTCSRSIRCVTVWV